MKNNQFVEIAGSAGVGTLVEHGIYPISGKLPAHDTSRMLSPEETAEFEKMHGRKVSIAKGKVMK